MFFSPMLCKTDFKTIYASFYCKAYVLLTIIFFYRLNKSFTHSSMTLIVLLHPFLLITYARKSALLPITSSLANIQNVYTKTNKQKGLVAKAFLARSWDFCNSTLGSIFSYTSEDTYVLFNLSISKDYFLYFNLHSDIKRNTV